MPEPEGSGQPARRSGFSFYRFLIPSSATTRAAPCTWTPDMQVFADMAELWEDLPSTGDTVLCAY